MQGSLAASGRDGTDTAFKRCNSLFKHSVGRVTEPRVNVPRALDIKKRRRVIRIGKAKGCCLVDRRGSSTRRGIWLRTGMECQCVEAGIVGSCHDVLLVALCRQILMPPSLVSRYSSIPSRAPSRPSPLSFIPPNGAAALVGLMSLIPIMPNCSCSKVRSALARFWV